MSFSSHKPLALCAILLLFGAAHTTAQPIPVELTITDDYATTNMVVSKTFSPTSPLGFFHLSTIEIDYDDTSTTNFALQNQIFAELPGGLLRFTGGAFHSERGFNPTAGAQIIKATGNAFVLVAPRVNFGSSQSYSVFSLVRYRPQIHEGVRLYLGAQLLNTFSAERHLRSYQWLRAGLEVKGTQFGLALNFDEDGPDPRVVTSVGVFVRRELF